MGWFKRAFSGADPASDYGRLQREALEEAFGAPIERLLAAHFQLTAQRAALPEARADLPRLTALSALGFPGLFLASTYLDAASAGALGATRQLPGPALCTQCGQPGASTRLAAGSWLKPDGSRERFDVAFQVCADHALSAAIVLPLVALIERTPGLTMLTAVGDRPDVCSALAEITGSGDPLPPWRAFPGELPEWGGWRQGNGEYWLQHVWMPFWNDRSVADRQRYLATWDAPDAWRDVVMAW